MVPEGTGIWHKTLHEQILTTKKIDLSQRDRGQGEDPKTGDRRQGRSGKEQEKKGKGCLSRRDKGLPLDREETAMAHRQMAVC